MFSDATRAHHYHTETCDSTENVSYTFICFSRESLMFVAWEFLWDFGVVHLVLQSFCISLLLYINGNEGRCFNKQIEHPTFIEKTLT